MYPSRAAYAGQVGVGVPVAPPASAVPERRRRLSGERVLDGVVGQRRPLPPEYRVVAHSGKAVLALRDGGCDPRLSTSRRVLARPPFT